MHLTLTETYTTKFTQYWTYYFHRAYSLKRWQSVSWWRNSPPLQQSKLHCRLNNRPPLDPSLHQVNSFHDFTLYCYKMHS